MGRSSRCRPVSSGFSNDSVRHDGTEGYYTEVILNPTSVFSHDCPCHPLLSAYHPSFGHDPFRANTFGFTQ